MRPDRLGKCLGFSFALFCFLSIGCAIMAEQAEIAPSPQGEAVLQRGQMPLTQAQSAPSLEALSFEEEGDRTRIKIVATETLDLPPAKMASLPPRLIIDFPKADVAGFKEPVTVGNGTVDRIWATQYDDKARIEIGLTQVTDYRLSSEGKTWIVDIEKPKRTADTKMEPSSRTESAIREAQVIVPDKVQSEPEVTSSSSKKEEPVLEPQALPGGKRVKEKEAAPTFVKSLGPAREVIKVVADQKDDWVQFALIVDGRPGNYNFFKMEAPPRLVVDFWGVDSRSLRQSIRISNPFVREIRVGRHPDKMRFVFDSLHSQLPLYQITRLDDRLIVSFGNVPPLTGPQILMLEKTSQIEEKPPKAAREPAQVVQPQSSSTPKSPPPTKLAKSAQVTSLDFKQLEDKSRVLVGLTGESTFESQKIDAKNVAIDIRNAYVPLRLQRMLDTSAFEGPVTAVHINNVKTAKGNDVRMLIKLRQEVSFEITKEGQTLVVDFERPKTVQVKATPVVAVKGEEPKKEEGRKEEAPKEEPKREELKPPVVSVEPKAEPSAPAVPPKPLPPQVEPAKAEEVKKVSEEKGAEKVYTGRKVSLDFKDADIRNILRLIAEVSNLNIIASEDVTGKITMRLVDVPWDQALDVVLQARALGMARVGNVIRVAPLETLKKETQAELEAKRAKERLEDLVTELIPVNYATAKELVTQVKSVLSDRGDVKVDDRTNVLIVKDLPRNMGNVKNLVKALDTKTPQVLIEARIVEANLTFQRELGVSWGFETVAGNPTGNIGTVSGGLPGGKVVDLPALPKAGTAGVLEFLFNSNKGLRELDVAISAHEMKGDVRIISSPKIATLDNKEASIEQGLRIPYLKLTTEGTVTTDFIDANLKLTVTPHVTNDGNIKLNIKAKKDAPDRTIEVQGVPSIDKKEAITEVLIKDNGVVVIAGIYTIEKTDSTEGIPLFSKIPLLGWLFKREAKEDKRKDLLIFISPKIIRDQQA